jgi:hypothetical protein
MPTPLLAHGYARTRRRVDAGEGGANPGHGAGRQHPDGGVL